MRKYKCEKCNNLSDEVTNFCTNCGSQFESLTDASDFDKAKPWKKDKTIFYVAGTDSDDMESAIKKNVPKGLQKKLIAAAEEAEEFVEADSSERSMTLIISPKKPTQAQIEKLSSDVSFYHFEPGVVGQVKDKSGFYTVISDEI